MRRNVVLVLVVTFAGGQAASAGAAQDITLRGTVGMLHEWSLDAKLTATRQAEAYDGALTMRHTGLCDSHGESTKTGTLNTIIRDGRLYALALKFGDQECTLAGPMRLRDTSTHDVLRCNKGTQVPIVLWSEPSE